MFDDDRAHRTTIRLERQAELFAQRHEQGRQVVHGAIGEPSGTYARALARFGEQGVMDLVGVNGFYSLISMALNVGRTPLPAGVAPALKPMPR